MEPLINILFILFTGLLVGVMATWLVLRERISVAVEKAKGESQVDVARLNERLTASQEDANRLTKERE